MRGALLPEQTVLALGTLPESPMFSSPGFGKAKPTQALGGGWEDQPHPWSLLLERCCPAALQPLPPAHEPHERAIPSVKATLGVMTQQ